MLDPYSLFSYEPHVDSRTVRARTLVVTLGSFADAGHVQKLVDDHVLNSLTNHRLGSFDADQVVDYRGNRPRILFSVNTFTGYEEPEFVLHEVTDAKGEDFLLLTGPEPDLQWARMAKAVEHIVVTHGIETVAVIQSMPMPVPHSRPLHVTWWASRPELVSGHTSVFGNIQMGTAFPLMLAHKLGESGHDAVGFSVHVPHYLGDHDFPDAAISAIEALHEATGLDIPTIQLEVAASLVRSQIQQQIEGSEELTLHVEQLEEGYDEFSRQREIQAAAEDLPSADEIGEAAEDFLRSLDTREPGAPEE